MSIRHSAFVATLFLGFGSISGCSSVGIPEDKRDYVGEWQSVGMSLTITSDGGVNYQRTRGNGNTKVNGPIQAWNDDDFEVGVGPITTTFDVTEPPHLDGETWKMVVDGEELTRVR